MNLVVPAFRHAYKHCLYTFKSSHQRVNDAPASLTHHQQRRTSLTHTRWVPNPSPTPVQVHYKPIPTPANARDPTQTSNPPNEPGARQMRTILTLTKMVSPKRTPPKQRTTTTMTLLNPQGHGREVENEDEE
jgi:hypothetical protein